MKVTIIRLLEVGRINEGVLTKKIGDTMKHKYGNKKISLKNWRKTPHLRTID